VKRHFGYEERTLVANLNALPESNSVPADWLDHPQ